MPRLIWSTRALADVQRIFLRASPRDCGLRSVRAIRSGVQILARLPHVGRPVENMDPDFREWPIEYGRGGYIALYHYDGDRAVILAMRPG